MSDVEIDSLKCAAMPTISLESRLVPRCTLTWRFDALFKNLQKLLQENQDTQLSVNNPSVCIGELAQFQRNKWL